MSVKEQIFVILLRIVQIQKEVTAVCVFLVILVMEQCVEVGILNLFTPMLIAKYISKI